MHWHDKLRQVFRDALDLGADAEVDGLAYRAVPAWDSVGHMRLVAALESEFDVMLDTDEVIDLSCFDKACEILSRHLDG
ncbi:acyl carrier protein [Magnetospirillum sulfuroxidans]|uniref:Acyl carrier protein n=1 Tax=Magnetospirillum sulfuroxidans TaxID=611300 RepID=A0ABS5IAR7_9PROT|nr:acyl carrier protein [Magnetospirillum sulfuroxidans]MBR9971356.1 acyl carrier protein [Magnetospirillum sulfuroxidans]